MRFTVNFGRRILGMGATSLLLVVTSACGDDDPLDNESFSGRTAAAARANREPQDR